MDKTGQIKEMYEQIKYSTGSYTLDAKSCAEILYEYCGYRKVILCKNCADRNTEGCPLASWDGDTLVSNTEDDGFCSFARTKEEGETKL